MQLSSRVRRSQVSVSDAFAVMLHAPHVPPDPQSCVPDAQSPRKPAAAQERLSPWTQAQASLGTPLQFESSFRIEQLSPAFGAMLHAAHFWFTHACVPLLHAPGKGHARLWPAVQAHPSFGIPLQSASSPASSQSSFARGVMLHAAHAPAAHSWVPAAHAPSRPAAAHTRLLPLLQPQPSNATALQLSSPVVASQPSFG